MNTCTTQQDKSKSSTTKTNNRKSANIKKLLQQQQQQPAQGQEEESDDKFKARLYRRNSFSSFEEQLVHMKGINDIRLFVRNHQKAFLLFDEYGTVIEFSSLANYVMCDGMTVSKQALSVQANYKSKLPNILLPESLKRFSKGLTLIHEEKRQKPLNINLMNQVGRDIQMAIKKIPLNEPVVYFIAVVRLKPAGNCSKRIASTAQFDVPEVKEVKRSLSIENLKIFQVIKQSRETSMQL